MLLEDVDILAFASFLALVVAWVVLPVKTGVPVPRTGPVPAPTAAD